MPLKIRIRPEIAIIFLLLSCAEGEKREKIDYKIFVEVDTVKFGELRRSFKAWCIVKPSKVVAIVSDVDGIVRKINFKPGEYIREGDTFAEIYRGPVYKSLPIISSSGGVLDGVFVEEGSPVKAGTVLGVISRGRREVEIYIPLKMRKMVKVGGEFLLNGKVGKINYISNVPADSILSFVARGNLEGAVEVGIYTCNVILEKRKDVHFVRSSAILGDTLVYKVVGDRVKAVKVKRIFEDDEGNVAIESELRRGDTVVVLGGEMLREGSRVAF